MQESKLKQSHKTLNIPHFTSITTNHPYKQGGGILIYLVVFYVCINISFSQLETLNISLIELQIIKIHLSAYSNNIFIYLFYLHIYPPDSQESDGGADT